MPEVEFFIIEANTRYSIVLRTVRGFTGAHAPMRRTAWLLRGTRHVDGGKLTFAPLSTNLTPWRLWRKVDDYFKKTRKEFLDKYIHENLTDVKSQARSTQAS